MNDKLNTNKLRNEIGKLKILELKRQVNQSHLECSIDDLKKQYTSRHDLDRRAI
jgi:hypothetical protein